VRKKTTIKINKQVRQKTSTIDARRKTLLAREYLDAKKAIDPVILDLRDITLITDYFVICSGSSTTHVRGLANFVAEEFDKEGLRSSRVEGYQNADWILIDYGDVIVHIFTEELRELYSLERLWSDAPQVPASETPVVRSSVKKPRHA
jgi:ribosome-associated protein